MVEIEYKPMTKIIVHEIIKYDFDKFVEAKSKKPGNVVQWADGIVMVRAGFGANSPKMIEEQAEGITHWAVVEYAEMLEYKKTITNDSTGASIMVNDVSTNTALTDFVRWLKNDSPWKDTFSK